MNANSNSLFLSQRLLQQKSNSKFKKRPQSIQGQPLTSSIDQQALQQLKAANFDQNIQHSHTRSTIELNTQIGKEFNTVSTSSGLSYQQLPMPLQQIKYQNLSKEANTMPTSLRSSLTQDLQSIFQSPVGASVEQFQRNNMMNDYKHFQSLIIPGTHQYGTQSLEQIGSIQQQYMIPSQSVLLRDILPNLNFVANQMYPPLRNLNGIPQNICQRKPRSNTNYNSNLHNMQQLQEQKMLYLQRFRPSKNTKKAAYSTTTLTIDFNMKSNPSSRQSNFRFPLRQNIIETNNNKEQQENGEQVEINKDVKLTLSKQDKAFHSQTSTNLLKFRQHQQKSIFSPKSASSKSIPMKIRPRNHKLNSDLNSIVQTQTNSVESSELRKSESNVKFQIRVSDVESSNEKKKIEKLDLNNSSPGKHQNPISAQPSPRKRNDSFHKNNPSSSDSHPDTSVANKSDDKRRWSGKIKTSLNSNSQSIVRKTVTHNPDSLKSLNAVSLPNRMLMKKTMSSDQHSTGNLLMIRQGTNFLGTGSRLQAELNKKKEINKKAKQIRELYQRDHSYDDCNNMNDIKSEGIHSLDSFEESNLSHSMISSQGAKHLNPSPQQQINNFSGQKSQAQNKDHIILDAVYSNDSERIKSLINELPTFYEKQKKINFRDKHKRTALFYAINFNNYEIVNFLLNNGAETMFSDELDRTVLHYAAITGASKNIVQLLLDFNTRLSKEGSHTQEAVDEFASRKPNLFDLNFTAQSGKKTKKIMLFNTLSKSAFNSGPLTMSTSSSLSVVQPMTSLMPKKNRQLDINALSVPMKDDGDSSPMKKRRLKENGLSPSDKSSTQQFAANTGLNAPNPFQLSRKATLKKSSNLLNTLCQSQQQNNILEDPETKMMIERKIKKTKTFLKHSKAFINLSDIKGKTALQYAAFKNHKEIVQMLCYKFRAITFIRDHQGRKALDLVQDEEVRQIIEHQETIYQEKYSGSTLNMRKSLVLDEFDRKMRNVQNVFQTNNSVHQAIHGNKKTQDSYIKEESSKDEDDDDVESQQNKNQLNQNNQLSKKVQFNKSEMASISDQMLAKYCIGIYRDNSLTYRMRFDDKESFQYLLLRGISPLSENSNGHNVMHHAVMLEKLEFLTFLCEGNWESETMKLCSQTDPTLTLEDNYSYNLAKSIFENIRTNKAPWITESLLAIDKSDLKLGNTGLHISIDQGNLQVFTYILAIIKARDHLRCLDINRFQNLLASSSILEFMNKQDNSPLLFAAKRNQGQMFSALIGVGCDLRVRCNKLMNSLHYSILNENTQIIQQIVWADAESGNFMLHQEKNFRNETPFMLDDKGKFEWIFHHIWEIASINTNDGLQKLDAIIKADTYSVNQKTLIGKNTPLHFAVMHENLKAIDLLCKQHDIKVNEKNAIGQTAADLALLIPKKKIALKIYQYIAKRLQVQQQMKPQLTISPLIKVNGIISPECSDSLKSANTLNTDSLSTLQQKRRRNSKNLMINTSHNINTNSALQQAKQIHLLIQNKNQLSSNQKGIYEDIFEYQVHNLVSTVSSHPAFEGSIIQVMIGSRNSPHSFDSSCEDEGSVNDDQLFGIPTLNKRSSYQTAITPQSGAMKSLQNWDFAYCQKLLVLYSNFTDNAELLGVFSQEIFKKWKTQMQKQDEIRKQELKDIFRKIDDKSKGALKLEQIMKIGRVNISEKLFNGNMEQVNKFEDFLARQYENSKITENAFVNLVHGYLKHLNDKLKAITGTRSRLDTNNCNTQTEYTDNDEYYFTNNGGLRTFDNQRLQKRNEGVQTLQNSAKRTANTSSISRNGTTKDYLTIPQNLSNCKTTRNSLGGSIKNKYLNNNLTMINKSGMFNNGGIAHQSTVNTSRFSHQSAKQEIKTYQPWKFQYNTNTPDKSQLFSSRTNQTNSENTQGKYVVQLQGQSNLSYDQIQTAVKQLMYLKGELIQDKVILVIKRPILVKIFLESKLLEKQDKHDFEIMINKEYGNNKHGFTLENINKIVVLIGQKYFQKQFNQSPKQIILKILQSCLIPYVFSLLNSEDQTSFCKFINSSPKQYNEIHSQLQIAKPTLQTILNHYKSKALHTNLQKHDRILIFNQVILKMIKDLDIVPYVISSKDVYCIYELQKETTFNDDEDLFGIDQFLDMLSIISQYWITDFLYGNSESNEREKVQVILKRIELSQGYDNFRKEVIIEGGYSKFSNIKVRPPVLIYGSGSTTAESDTDMNYYKRMSRCNTSNYLINSARGSSRQSNERHHSSQARELFISQSDVSQIKHQINDYSEEINFLFEYYSKLEDRGKLKNIKSAQLYKLIKDIMILNPSSKFKISQNELDILIQRVKLNLGTQLTFEEFLLVLSELCQKYFLLSIEDLCAQLLIPLYRMIESYQGSSAPQKQIIQSQFEGQNLKNLLISLNASDSTPKTMLLLSKLKGCLEPYFKVFTRGLNKSQHMTLNEFRELLKTFDLYPDLIKKSDLELLYEQLLHFDPKKKFCLDQMVQALGLIALAHFDCSYSVEQRILLMIEKIAIVQREVDVKINTKMGNGGFVQSTQKGRDMIRVFQKQFMTYFPEQWGLTPQQQKKQQMSLKDIMNMEDDNQEEQQQENQEIVEQNLILEYGQNYQEEEHYETNKE